MTDTKIATAAAFAGVTDLGNLTDVLDNAAADRPTSTGMKPFLKMEKDGTWVYGPENIEVQPGSLWAVNPASLMRGYICWTSYPDEMKRKNERLGEVMVPLSGRRPLITELPEYHDPDGLNGGQPWPWTDAMGVDLVCLTGEDEGTEVVYNTNSKSGVRMLNEYFDELMVKAREGKPIAVVEMSKDSYPHKKYGKIVTPVFDVKEWRPADDTGAPKAVEKAETPAAPADKKNAGNAPAPTRSRRRPAA